jgi:hypothetical protein
MLQEDERRQSDEGYLAGLMERTGGVRAMYSRFRKAEWRTKTQAWRVGYRDGYNDRVGP